MKVNTTLKFCAICIASTMTIVSTATAIPKLEEIVVTASRKDQSITEVGSNIAFITDLEKISQTHINEAMQRISGIWISRGNGQEHLTAIRSPVLTGAGGCGAFLMAQDGISLRASGFCNVNELFDANTEQAGQIEVIKGPGSIVYGSNALHGTINILTPTINNQKSISIEGGPHDYYRAKATIGSESWRLDVNGTSDGGYKHDSGFDQQKATLKINGQAAGFDLTTVMALSNLNQETAGFIQGDEAYKDDSAVRQNPNPEAYRDNKTARLYSQMTKKLNDGSEIKITPYLRKTRMEFIQHFLPGQAVEENGQQSIGIQSSWHVNQWLVGMDAEFTNGFLKESQENSIVGSAFLSGTIPAGDHYDYEVDARSIALFAQYDYDINESTRLQIGGRLENVNYDYNNRMLTGRTKDDGTDCGFGGCRFNRPADREDSFTNFSPRLSLTHLLSEENQVYFQLSRGFRAPQATELYRLQAGQSVSQIDSEALDSIELGFRGNSGMLNYDLSFYGMKKDNFIFRDTNRAAVDNGKTSHRGIELSLNYSFNDSFSWDMVASYARHQYENNPALSRSLIKGNDIDTAPRKTGSMRLQWQPIANIESELEWVFMGEYFEDPENLNEYEGHSLVNLRASYTLGHNSKIFMRIINLTDTEYAERADFAFGSDRYFVGEPRSLYFGYSTQF